MLFGVSHYNSCTHSKNRDNEQVLVQLHLKCVEYFLMCIENIITDTELIYSTFLLAWSLSGTCSSFNS